MRIGRNLIAIVAVALIALSGFYVFTGYRGATPTNPFVTNYANLTITGMNVQYSTHTMVFNLYNNGTATASGISIRASNGCSPATTPDIAAGHTTTITLSGCTTTAGTYVTVTVTYSGGRNSTYTYGATI